MIPRVVMASYVRDYTLHIRFADGVEGDLDFSAELEGEVFVPLRDLSFFQRFQVNSELGTVVWPNGADFAPEFLYSKVHVTV